MTGARAHLILIVLTAILTVAAAIFFFAEPVLTLRGWLVAFVWVTMVPIGSLFLLAIHRLTGGEWGLALSPVLEPAARAIGPMALLSLPILLFSGRIYRWSDSSLPEVVARFYMNAPFYALRTVVALMVWSAFAWTPSLRNTPSRAAIVLIVLGLITNIIPVDWVVSAQPGFYSSAFGFGFSIEQMLAALAFCAIVGPQGEERRECRDLAGLLVALLLAWTYFFYIQFAIVWYGNLPEKAAWYVIRSEFPWPHIGGFAFTIGAVLPFLALLNKEVRQSKQSLRLIGAAMFLAILLHAIWLVVPSLGTATLAPAILNIALMGTMFALWLLRNVGWAPPHEDSSKTVASLG